MCEDMMQLIARVVLSHRLKILSEVKPQHTPGNLADELYSSILPKKEEDLRSHHSEGGEQSNCCNQGANVATEKKRRAERRRLRQDTKAQKLS